MKSLKKSYSNRKKSFKKSNKFYKKRKKTLRKKNLVSKRKPKQFGGAQTQNNINRDMLEKLVIAHQELIEILLRY